MYRNAPAEPGPLACAFIILVQCFFVVVVSDRCWQRYILFYFQHKMNVFTLLSDVHSDRKKTTRKLAKFNQKNKQKQKKNTKMSSQEKFAHREPVTCLISTQWKTLEIREDIFLSLPVPLSVGFIYFVNTRSWGINLFHEISALEFYIHSGSFLHSFFSIVH